MKPLILSFSLLMTLSSCSHSQITSKEDSQSDEFNVLYQSEYGGTGKDEQEIIEDQESFEKKWNDLVNAYSDTEKVPSIDFGKNRVVIKTFQSRNSGGFTYDVDSVKSAADKTEVFYTISSSGNMATQAITNPMIILSIPQSKSSEVEFKLKK